MPSERPQDLKPYPENPFFVSQSVLSEGLREQIYKRVVHSGDELKSVSVLFGVDVRRVAAVVRLKTLEKQWLSEVSAAARTVPLAW